MLTFIYYSHTHVCRGSHAERHRTVWTAGPGVSQTVQLDRGFTLHQTPPHTHFPNHSQTPPSFLQTAYPLISSSSCLPAARHAYPVCFSHTHTKIVVHKTWMCKQLHVHTPLCQRNVLTQTLKLTKRTPICTGLPTYH